VQFERPPWDLRTEISQQPRNLSGRREIEGFKSHRTRNLSGHMRFTDGNLTAAAQFERPLRDLQTEISRQPHNLSGRRGI
jgi:hypothetical protein